MRKLIFTLLLFSCSFLTQAQTTVFSEDFENPPGNVTSSGTPGWFINSRLQTSGVNSDSAAIVNPGDASYLTTGPFDCSFNFFVTLSFKSICKLEFFDAGTIEISTDGGVTWVQLVDNVGGVNNNCNYLGTGNFRSQNSKFEEASYANWQPGSPSVPDNSWWQTETFDLSLLAGNQPDVRLRFKSSDENNSGGNNRDGWFIDDVTVIASFCELIPPAIYPLAPTYGGTVYNLGPYNVNIATTDNSGIASAFLSYTINGVAQPTIQMTNVSDSTYTAQIPTVNDSDVVCYQIQTTDASFCGNVSYYPSDTSFICFTASSGILFPYCDNFDLTTNLWTAGQVNGTGTSNWELGTPSFGTTNSAYSAPNSWDIDLTSGYLNNANCYLLSPVLGFTTGAGATLSFWQNRNCEGFWDGVRVEWATNLAGPWTILGSVGCTDCINWYTNPAINSSGLPAWDGSSGGWIQSSIILDQQFNNQPQVWFRFVFTSDGSVTYDGFSIDNFCLTLPQPDDVGVTAITSPGITSPAGTSLPVDVTVKNFGINPQTTFDVQYTINGTVTGTATYNGPTLNAGDVGTLTLPAFTVPTGAYNICAYTQLAGDGNNYNDTTCKGSTGIPVLTLTACDDFENGNQGYIDSTSNNQIAQWQLGTPNFGVCNSAHSGVNAWDINLNTGYGVGGYASLTTPIYDVTTAVNPYLSFFRNQQTASNDGLRILYNVNGSGNWTVLGTVGDPDGLNWYNNTSLNFSGQPGWDGSSGGWAESRYYLQNMITLTGAQYLQFRFEFVSGFNGTPNDGVTIDDLCVKQPGPDDVGVVAIIEPGPNNPAGSTSNVTVTIRNFGTATQTTIPIEYKVGGIVTGNGTYNGSLAPNATANVSLPTFTVPSGQFDFCAYTQLPGDGDNSNDTSCTSPVGVPVIPITYTSPYIENFDGTNVGWFTQNSGNPTTIWELGPPNFGQTSSAHSAPNAWDVNLNSAYGNSANCALYSPIFDLTNAVDPDLTFWINHNCEQNWDGVRLEYSIANGPWTLLGGPNLTPPCWINWYNMATINSSNLPAWAGATGGWVKVEGHCLSIFNNSLVQFRFIFTSDASVTQDGFSIDDFNLTIPVPLTAAPLNITTNTINNNFIFPGQVVQFTSPISNPGTTALSSVNATITINGVPLVTDPITYNPALTTSQNLAHIFSQTWTAAPGVYQVCVYTSDPNNSIDLNPFDDTTCITISVFDSVTVTSNNPYCTDFETGPQWVSVNSQTYNVSASNEWQLGTPAKTIINGAYSGTNAWTINLTGNYANRDSSGLFSPVFSVDNTKCYHLSFWHKYDTEPYADGGTVEYSTDNANTWSQLGFASATPQPWFNTPFITALGGNPGTAGWSGTESNWVKAEKDVTFNTSGTAIFRFRFATDNTVNNYEGWAIDNFCFEEITGPCTVGLNDPTASSLNLSQNYPNPFSNSSTIEYSIPTAGDVKVSITNMLGQEVAVPVNGKKDAGTHSFEVNSKVLGAGIYYYSLEFEGQKITRKMVITE